MNVVIFRFNTGMSLTFDRSECFSCGKKLVWYELIPIISYLIQRGKCRGCSAPISWQYPLVELVTAVLFTLAYHQFGFSFTLLGAFVGIGLVIVIAGYDWHHYIIPNTLAYSFAALGFVGLFIREWSTGQVALALPSTSQLLAGPILFGFFWSLWKFSDGRWMGLGDGKLALGIGWWLGLVEGIWALCYAFWIGAAVSLMYIAYQKMDMWGKSELKSESHALTMKSEIPFGPFLVIGFMLQYLFDFQLLFYL